MLLCSLKLLFISSLDLKKIWNGVSSMLVSTEKYSCDVFVTIFRLSGSADSDSYDQLLDVVSVGPIKVGYNKFVFVAPAPDIVRILFFFLFSLLLSLGCRRRFPKRT